MRNNMKIIKRIKKETEIEEIEDILCNKCGNSLMKSDTDYKGPGFNGLKEVRASFAYGSCFDGDDLIFSVCEKCTLEFVTSFKIDPDYIGINSCEQTKSELYKQIKSIYGFERSNENIKINSLRDNCNFMSTEELTEFHKKLKEELDFINKNGINALLTR